MISLYITGTLRDADTRMPLSDLYVKAYDEDLLYDDLLGGAVTDKRGRFEIVSDASDFREFFELRPEIYLKVYAPDRETLLYESQDSVRVSAGGAVGEFEVAVPHDKLGEYAPRREIRLVGGDGTGRDEYDIGESLRIGLDGLPAQSAAELTIHVNGETRFTIRLVSNEEGRIPETTVWPHMGLESHEGEPLTIEEARSRWAGREIGLTVQVGGETIAETSFTFPDRFARPLLVPVDSEGRVSTGFVAATSDAAVEAVNVPYDGAARVYMVARQGDWQPGDRFEPVRLTDRSEAFVDVEIEDGRFRAQLAAADVLRPGAYDFIVRNMRYGYEDAEDFRLRDSDLVTRAVTGLVVREDFRASKPVLGACTNVQSISGRKLYTSPYFEYADTFQLGEDVWGALDPNALDPGMLGKMTAFYVVEHKTQSQWSSDPSLNHLSALGGNTNVIVAKTQPTCINANDFLLWPSASETGEYDIVADFGNDASSPSAFAQDDTFDPPKDIIDGYYLPGFRVLQDPTTETSHSHDGNFEYNDGTTTVQDKNGADVTVEKKAVVRFPADAAGKSDPSQISTSQASYPVVVIAHGNSSDTNSYKGYDYLLEHLAKNGFIATSYHMKPGMKGVDRAALLFEHLDSLKSQFGSSMANNIGIMGHSRGGEAVAIAPRLNHQESHGWNLNAVVSIAPTDQYTNETIKNPWATPYLVIYGSLDGDVAGGYTSPMRTGFAIYDRAQDDAKSMLFVYGASHGRFNTVWGDFDLDTLQMWVDTIGPGEKAKAISMDAHQKIAKGYAAAFFRQHLMGATEFRGMFAGEWIPSAVEAADGGSVELYVQYGDTTRDVVDDFEGTHTATSWQSSTIGGTVDDGGTLPSDPTEDELYDIDSHSPHVTAGLLLEWNDTSDELQFTVPSGHRDVAAYSALSFRVTQKVGSPANPMGEQDLYVTLEDGSSGSRKVKVSAFGMIPEPYERYYNQFTKSAMNTIRVPLDAFVIKVPGPGPVDLNDVRHVTFDFERNPTGEIEIDSVEFTD